MPCRAVHSSTGVLNPSGPDVTGEVSDRHRPEVLEQPRPVGPLRQSPVLGRREAGAEQPSGRVPLAADGDRAVAGAGQGAAAVDQLAQQGIEIETRADPQEGREQPGRSRNASFCWRSALRCFVLATPSRVFLCILAR